MTTEQSQPLSPHLQVYRPQLTSMLSILHRITGAALALGAIPFTGWLIAAAQGADSYQRFMDCLHSPFGQVLAFGWLFSLCFHFFNGLRHLVWDTGRWLTLKSAYASGYTALACAIVATLLIWFVG